MDSQQLLAGLSQAGVNVQEALERFMGNQTLYLTFLCRLPQAMELDAIEQALCDGQSETFYTGIHNLKGMAGNLSIPPLFGPAQRILDEYRSRGLDRPDVLRALLEEIRAAAAPLTALIQQYQAASAKGGCS